MLEAGGRKKQGKIVPLSLFPLVPLSLLFLLPPAFFLLFIKNFRHFEIVAFLFGGVGENGVPMRVGF